MERQLDQSCNSSESTLTRQEFIKTVLNRAAAAGALMTAPAIADKFLVPKAFAQSSTCSASDTGGTPGDTSGSGDFRSVTTPGGGGVDTGGNSSPTQVETGCSAASPPFSGYICSGTIC